MNKNILYVGILVVIVLIGYLLFQRANSDIQHLTFQDPQSIAEWREYTSQSGDFTVMLPGLPQHVTDTVPLANSNSAIKYDMYLAQANRGSTFMISLINYPSEFDTSDVNGLLDGVMKEMMAGNSGNELTWSQKGTFQGAPSIDFTIQNKDVFIQSKAFLMNKTLYVLTLMDQDLNNLEVQFKQFIDSFKLKDTVQNSSPVSVGLN